MCGDGDEAHCVVNASDSFCSCRTGFQSSGRNTCKGALVPALPRRTLEAKAACNPGRFHLADKNECEQFGVCSHMCNNTKGSYKCSCHKYFTKINDSCKADGEL